MRSDVPDLRVTGTDRRRAVRRSPTGDEPLARMRLRAGRELIVVDLSNAGALIEGTARLLPGTHVDVHIVTGEGRTLVRSRVVRAYVCHVEAELVRYRGAIAFERAIDAASPGYAVPEVLATVAGPAGTAYPDTHAHRELVGASGDLPEDSAPIPA